MENCYKQKLCSLLLNIRSVINFLRKEPENLGGPPQGKHVNCKPPLSISEKFWTDLKGLSFFSGRMCSCSLIVVFRRGRPGAVSNARSSSSRRCRPQPLIVL